jgi:hypothetical protein
VSSTLLEHLIDERVVPVSEPPARTVLDELVDGYHEWLVDDRGLAATTVLRCENTARRFLQQGSFSAGSVDLVGLTGVEVSARFCLPSAPAAAWRGEGPRCGAAFAVAVLVSAGLTRVPLAAAVPPVAGWHNTGIPPTLSRRMSRRCSRAATGLPRSECATSRS